MTGPTYLNGRRSELLSEEEREKSGFLRVSRADERLHSLGLKLEEALKLTSFSLQGREPQLFGLASLIHDVIINLYQEAQEMFCGATSFSSLQMDVATNGTKGMSTPFRFLPRDSKGDRTRKRYPIDA